VRRVVLAALAAGLAGGPLAASAATHVVTIRGFAFEPQTLAVAPGDVIEWVNKDIVDHTATSVDPAFDSKGVRPGASWRWTAARAGQYRYVCAFHPSMTGVIEVK
jgi:plastocyanin